ncbi:MAG: NAD-dependent epimerase/dehydratase family protein [Planctomycetota bacterium]
MKRMVTGGTGFTGGALVRRLLADGHEVRALVRPGSDVSGLDLPGVELIEGQLTSMEDVSRAMEGCDKAYHIAAVFRTAGHPDSYYYEINLDGTRVVLDAARKLGLERVVHCSTGGVHGHIRNPPANEQAPYAPGDVYQESKLAGEKLCQERAKAGEPIVIFRPGPIYGPGDTRFLKLFKALSSGRFRMIGKGEVRLHLTYIDDLVDGIVRCGERPEALGEIFILAGYDAPKLKDLMPMVAKALGVKPPRGHIPLAPVKWGAWLCEKVCIPLRIEPPLHRRRVGFFTHHREFDISHARNLLGYDPQVSAEQGMAASCRWCVEQGLLAPTPGIPRTPDESDEDDTA